MNYKDLRTKTIYDFTSDANVIAEICGGMTKAEYLALIEDNPINNGLDLAELADLTKNEQLAAAVTEQYKADFANYFNE